MQRAMRQTLQRFSGGSSSSSLYSCRCPTIPKQNPNISLHLLPPSSSSSDQFSRVTHGLSEAPRNYFYCSTEEFKRLLIEYKKDMKTYPLVMAARIARVGKHEEEDDRLMEKLGVLLCRPMLDGECIEVKSPYKGLPMYEPVGEYPPNPYGIRGSMFFLFGEAGGNVKINVRPNQDI